MAKLAVATVLLSASLQPSVVDSMPAPALVASAPTAPTDWSGLKMAMDRQVWFYATAATNPVPVRLELQPRAEAKPKRSYASDGSVWDRIAACESGGDWSTNTGNGYFGGLQEDMAFWRSYGGTEFASRPDLASREQQIVVAERARDSGRGYSPWPVCGRYAA